MYAKEWRKFRITVVLLKYIHCLRDKKLRKTDILFLNVIGVMYQVPRRYTIVGYILDSSEMAKLRKRPEKQMSS